MDSAELSQSAEHRVAGNREQHLREEAVVIGRPVGAHYSVYPAAQRGGTALALIRSICEIEEAVEDLIHCCAPVYGDSRRLRFNFRVGVTEAIANAILYGNEEDPTKEVRVELLLEDEGILVQVTDEGRGFDPAKVPDPTLPENVGKSAYRGIFLMRELMDDVRFSEEGNSVTLALRLAEKRDPSAQCR